MAFDDAMMLAISTIQNSNGDNNKIEHIKMSQIRSDSNEFEFINNEKIKQLSDQAKIKYPSEKK